MDNYMAARSAGVRGVKNLFSLDAPKLLAATVRRALEGRAPEELEGARLAELDRYYDEHPIEDARSCTEHTLQSYLEEHGYKLISFETKQKQDRNGRWYAEKASWWEAPDGRRVRGYLAVQEVDAKLAGAASVPVVRREDATDATVAS